MSLVELAERRSLPPFQYMDSETCDWIEENNPRLGYRGKPAAIARDLFRTIRLSPNWFQESRTIESIHGMRHLCRCGWYALYLAPLLQFDERMTTNLILAAMLHDIRREHDKDDAGHADRGSAWFRSHFQEVQSMTGVSLAAEDVDSIALAIELHEIPYDRFSDRNRQAYARATRLTDGLKAADALDRYRLPKLKWWPNDSHLNMTLPNWLKQTAFDIVLKTERARSSHWTEPWKVLEATDPTGS